MPSNTELLKIILAMEDKATKQLGGAEKAVAKLSSTVSKVGKTMSLAVTLPLVGVAAAGVKMAADFEESMKNIQVISHQTDTEIAALGNQFLSMSSDINQTLDSPQQLAEAFYDIQSAGFAGQQGLDVLAAATKAAAGGLSDTKTSADAVTSVLNAYRKSADDAEHITDVMLKTVEKGKTTFGELASTISTVTPIASSAGISFEEVSAAIATLTASGTETSVAMTNVRSAIVAILKPTSAMQKAIEDLGYANGQALLDAKGFGGALNALADATGNDTAALTEMFGRIEGVNAALGVSGVNAAAYTSNLEAMANAAGTTAEAFAIQSQTFSAQMANLKNNLQVLGIQIGNILIPALSTIIQFITPVINAFSNLPRPVQTAIVIFAGFAAAIGPILAIIGSLLGGLGTIITVVGAVGAAFSAAAGLIVSIGTAIVGLNPIVLALVAAVGLAYLAFKNWDRIKEILSAIGQAVGDFLRSLIAKVKEFAQNLKQKIQGMVSDIKGFFKIGSPSKLMMDMGRQVGDGLQLGFTGSKATDTMVKNVKSAFRDMNKLSLKGPVMGFGTSAGVASTGGMSGGTSPRLVGSSPSGVNINTINVPPGTSEEQIRHIMGQIGKRVRQKGGYGFR